MNGPEKIETARKFDTMSSEDKQKVYDKFGKNIVDDEINRCKTIESIMDGKYDDTAADSIIDLFIDKKENIEKSDEILDFIRDL